MKKVAVIGGGASGMMAAVAAAENGAKVTIYEKNDRVGKKILVTGNGRCNFSNRDFSVDYYYGSKGNKEKLSRLFAQFSVEDTVRFFEHAGMLVKEKRGYLYPLSEQASTVLDILRLEIRRAGIETRLSAEVGKLTRGGGKLILHVTETAPEKENAAECGKIPGAAPEHLSGEMKPGKDRSREMKSGKERTEEMKSGESREYTVEYDAVILACGGCAAPKTGSDGSGYRLAKSLGHHIVATVPALVQLRCSDDFLKITAGVRCEAGLRLRREGKTLQEERGELQFTDYGISGIPVFQLSRRAAYLLKEKGKVTVSVDLLPDMEAEAFRKLCEERTGRAGEETLEELLAGMANKKISRMLIKRAGLNPSERTGGVDANRLQKLLYSYRDLTVHVTAVNPYENAQVTAGGVELEEVTDGLRSVKAPELYLAGEVLDVDGRCGGYNLQWAWTSGYIAGKNASM